MSSDRSPSRLSGKTIFWMVAIGLHLFGLIWQYNAGPWILEDSREYLAAAHNLAHHGVLYAGEWEAPERLDDYSKRPPIYPLLLWGTGATGGNLLWIFLVQNMLSLGSIWWISVLTRRITRADPPWLIWTVALVLTPSQWIYPQLVMTETLFQALLLVLGTLIWRSVKDNQGWLWLAMACLVIVAFLTKPVWYLFVVPFFFWAGFRAIRTRQWTLLIPGLLPVLVLTGYMFWNQSRTGYFHMSSIQVLSLHQYTTTNLLIDVYGPEEGIRKADSILYQALAAGEYAAEQRSFQASSAEVIRSHFFRYVWMHLKGMTNFFLDPGRFDLWSFFAIPPPEQGFLQVFSQGGYQGIFRAAAALPLGWLCYLGLIFLGNVVKAGSLLGFFWRYRQEAIGWIMVILFGYLAGLTGTSGASRFMVPLFPWMLMGLSFLRRKTSASKKKAG